VELVTSIFMPHEAEVIKDMSFSSLLLEYRLIWMGNDGANSWSKGDYHVVF